MLLCKPGLPRKDNPWAMTKSYYLKMLLQQNSKKKKDKKKRKNLQPLKKKASMKELKKRKVSKLYEGIVYTGSIWQQASLNLT